MELVFTPCDCTLFNHLHVCSTWQEVNFIMITGYEVLVFTPCDCTLFNHLHVCSTWQEVNFIIITGYKVLVFTPCDYSVTFAEQMVGIWHIPNDLRLDVAVMNMLPTVCVWTQSRCWVGWLILEWNFIFLKESVSNDKDMVRVFHCGLCLRSCREVETRWSLEHALCVHLQQVVTSLRSVASWLAIDRKGGPLV